MPANFVAKISVEDGKALVELYNKATGDFEALPIDINLFYKVAHWIKSAAEEAEKRKYWILELG